MAASYQGPPTFHLPPAPQPTQPVTPTVDYGPQGRPPIQPVPPGLPLPVAPSPWHTEPQKQPPWHPLPPGLPGPPTPPSWHPEPQRPPPVSPGPPLQAPPQPPAPGQRPHPPTQPSDPTQPSGLTLPSNRVPSRGELAMLPAGVTVDTPYGSVGADGRLALSPQGQELYKQAVVAKRRKFGLHPWAGDPRAPQPPVTLGRPSFNPFTGQWIGD